MNQAIVNVAKQTGLFLGSAAVAYVQSVAVTVTTMILMAAAGRAAEQASKLWQRRQQAASPQPATVAAASVPLTNGQWKDFPAAEVHSD